MMGEHKNWFARNKGFVFGFAVAVAILNIVIFVLMPQQTPIRIDETVTEYVCGDESFAAEHTIQLLLYFGITGQMQLRKERLIEPGYFAMKHLGFLGGVRLQQNLLQQTEYGC